MHPADCPRVLSVNNESLVASSATGLTLRSLLREWPSQRLVSLVTKGRASDAERLVGSADWQLARPVRAVQAACDRAAACRWAGSFMPRCRNRFWQYAFARDRRVSPELLAWIAAREPDLIYSTLYDLDVMQLVVNSSEALGIPIVPHFMDDWPEALRSLDPMSRALLHRYESLLQRVISRAPLALVISDRMAEVFEKRYGLRCTPVMRCVEVGDFQPPAPRAPIRIAYAGGLHLGRHESLLEVCDAVHTAIPNGSATLLVYVHEQDILRYGRLFGKYAPTTTLLELPPEEVPSRLQAADILLYVESFSPRFVSYCKCSISAKIPEYLAVGRPVLSYGPAESGSIDYLRRIEVGVQVTQRGRANVAEAVEQLWRQRSDWTAYAATAHAAARATHDAGVVTPRFRQAFLLASQAGVPQLRGRRGV